jgi:hypothetical protein
MVTDQDQAADFCTALIMHMLHTISGGVCRLYGSKRSSGGGRGAASHGAPPHRILHGPLRGSPDVIFCDDIPRAVLLRQPRHCDPAGGETKHGGASEHASGRRHLSCQLQVEEASACPLSSTKPAAGSGGSRSKGNIAVCTHDSCSEKLRKPAAIDICCSWGSPDRASAASWSSVRPRRLQAGGQPKQTVKGR